MIRFDLMHPRDLLVMFMDRVYDFGMTTTSGGNLSIRDENGTIWITPAGVDKGSLTWHDIVGVSPTGEVKGRHRPSSEYPFHKAIYDARPDIHSILHAHPSALVSFSIVRKVPPTRILPQSLEICGPVGYAPYELPGSEELGRNIARIFAEGFDTVLLENHGVVCGGDNMLHAFQRFETLDFCARLIIKASMIGEYKELTDVEVHMFRHGRNKLPEFDPPKPSSKEKALRRHICEIAHRSYEQKIMTSTEGVVSARLSKSSFLITPTSLDRKTIEPEDVVHVRRSQRERGKYPSRSVNLHARIYEDHPHVEAIVSAQGPNATAFSLTDRKFDTRTIPESYILLRDIPKAPYGPQFNDEGKISEMISPDTPVVLLQNDAILATGKSILEAFDRLEVAEFSARSLIDAITLGGLVAIGNDEIAALERKFLGKV